jgi:hypothetical protein
MKMKTIGLTGACFLLAAAASFAADPMMGTWKLNEAKSKFPPGIGGKVTVVYEAAGNQVKVTADGTSLDGTPVHNEWTGNFDGKDYPVTGDPSSDARSYKRIDDHTVDFTIKKDGNVTFTGRCVISADGKSHTATYHGATPDTKKFTIVHVYDKA